jgi:ABC-type transport system substrate-binding protein
VKQLVLPDETPSGAQGFFFNLRRDKFRDIRVRKALNLAFDFEWSNKNLFYGLYSRTASFLTFTAQGGRRSAAGGIGGSRTDACGIAAGSFRRAGIAAGERRLGPGPHALAPGLAASR